MKSRSFDSKVPRKDLSHRPVPTQHCPEPISCNEAIAVNSTTFEDDEKDTGERVFVGSKTETALLNFGKELGRPSYKETRDASQVIQIISFSSERKAMAQWVPWSSSRTAESSLRQGCQ